MKAALYLSAPSEGQHLHSWYVKLASTGFRGKLLTMYVHEPSLMMVIAKGRSIKTTLPQFYQRLPLLLQRNGFKPDFIEREIGLVKEGFVVSKTNSRSMLGFMNDMTANLEGRCISFPSYDLLDLSYEEDIFMDWLCFDSTLRKYRTPVDYWAERGTLLN